VLFGLSISIVGCPAITFAVCLGTSAGIGALIPLLISIRSTADSPRRPDFWAGFSGYLQASGYAGLPVTAATGPVLTKRDNASAPFARAFFMHLFPA